MATQSHKGGKKGRKYGRDSARCEAYRTRNQRERNKVKRLLRHLLHFEQDGCAKSALARYVQYLSKADRRKLAA